MKKIKILSVFGTRPEAIKMVPVVKALEQHENVDSYVCLTAQHREILDKVIDLFDVKVDFDLDLMQKNQSLSKLSSRMLIAFSEVLETLKPDLVLVHGDTSTTFVVSLACYYLQIEVGHVEAGLRTGNIYSPWPEEGNRKMTGILSKYHFCPTSVSKQNLLSENYPETHIYVTGNTVIDTLYMALKTIDGSSELTDKLKQMFGFLSGYKDAVLITGHRRENFGQGFTNICAAIKKLAVAKPELCFIYPVHPNPNVQAPVNEYLGGLSNVKLIEPMDYLPFIYLMRISKLILTDSGGIQEEAPGLGKPVLVLRNTTERPEGVAGGTVKLVGTECDNIFNETMKLLDNDEAYQAMSQANNPFGDGHAAQRIVDIVVEQGKVEV